MLILQQENVKGTQPWMGEIKHGEVMSMDKGAQPLTGNNYKEVTSMDDSERQVKGTLSRMDEWGSMDMYEGLKNDEIKYKEVTSRSEVKGTQLPTGINYKEVTSRSETQLCKGTQSLL